MQEKDTRYFLCGGAGFVGTNLLSDLMNGEAKQVTVYDDFSVGRKAHLDPYLTDKRLTVVQGKIEDSNTLNKSMAGHDVVYHFAANADIAMAVSEPDIDFRLGTLLTQNILEAMRITEVPMIIFTSGSGVYGDVPHDPVPEDYDKMIPISTYGASKLACEALISAYCYMFGLKGVVFRMGNVVGRYQTHGVGYDFLRRAHRNQTFLKILGDGKQTKPYIHIEDVISAYRLLERSHEDGYACFNLATNDHLTVTEIADIVVKTLGLSDVAYQYTGGTRGWKGDVPYYQLNCERILSRGWSPRRNSREAVTASIEAMHQDLLAGLFE